MQRTEQPRLMPGVASYALGCQSTAGLRADGRWVGPFCVLAAAGLLAQRCYAPSDGLTMLRFHLLHDVLIDFRVFEPLAVCEVLLPFSVIVVAEDAESASDRVPSAVRNVPMRVIAAVRTAVPADAGSPLSFRAEGS